MIISEQTLSDTEKEKVRKEACNFVDSLHLSSSKYPVGETTIPHKDPHWDYNNPSGQWEKEHFIICIKSGLQTSRRKPINSSKFSAVSQEPNENPTAFLERLKEAIIKYSNLDLDSLEGKTILKDRFLTQSAPDIRRKLRKLTQEPNVNLDEPLATATTTFYNWEQEEEVKAQEREKRKKNRQAQLLAALQGQTSSGEARTRPNGSQDRCRVCKKPGHWARECPNKDKPPKIPCPKCQRRGHWGANCPWAEGPRGQGQPLGWP